MCLLHSMHDVSGRCVERGDNENCLPRQRLLSNDHLQPQAHSSRHHRHHRRCRVADGRRVVAPPCPRSTARLQSSPIGRVESFRSWSSHLFRGRAGGRRHVRSGGRSPLDRYQIILLDDRRTCVCEQLAQGCYPKARGRESNPRPSASQVQRPGHYATHNNGFWPLILI